MEKEHGNQEGRKQLDNRCCFSIQRYLNIISAEILVIKQKKPQHNSSAFLVLKKIIHVCLPYFIV